MTTARVRTGRRALTGRIITDYSTADQMVTGANGRSTDLQEGLGTPPTVPEPRGSSVSGPGAFAVFGAVLIIIAISPHVNSQTFTPKFAVLLLFAAVGIVPLARLLSRRSSLRLPAIAATAFLGVALISALVSPSPDLGIFGLYLWGTGWLFWLGGAGAFAIGASLSGSDRTWLVSGLLIGALTSALLAIFQVASDAQSGVFALYNGSQADAALGNPIYLEALLLGGLALVLGRTCRQPLRWGAAVLVLSVGLEFTFERFALVVLALLFVCALYIHGIRRGGIYVLLSACGYAIAYATRGSGFGARVTAGTTDTTFGTRLRIWSAAAHYVLHHPLLGAGPGESRDAFDSTASLSFFQHVLAGRILTDSHDLFVEVAVTTGLLGLACFLVWLLSAARIAQRGDLLGFALAVTAVNLVEPINVATLPLALLALGAACSQSGLAPAHGQVATVTAASAGIERKRSVPALLVGATAVIVALFVGGTMVLGDAYMFKGTNSSSGGPYNVAEAKKAVRLLSYWPDPDLEVAQIEAFDAIAKPSGAHVSLIDSRDWTARALSSDSDDPHVWSLLGGANLQLKNYAAAASDFKHALRIDPWFTSALQGLGQVASVHRQWGQAVRWYRLALETVIRSSYLSVPIKGLLVGAERELTTKRA